MLAKKSSKPRHGYSNTNSSSNASGDNSDVSDLEFKDCYLAYESYAAVAKRNNQFVNIRWSDLQRAQSTTEVKKLLAALSIKRHITRDGEALELAALELCFEFLTFDELQRTAQVCTALHNIITTSKILLTGLYSRTWRNEMLPRVYIALPYRDQLQLCTARRSDTIYELSTRGAVSVLSNGNCCVLNNSMLRNFDKGAVDSIRGTKRLPDLACARALHKSIMYFEASLKGCGSVGLVSISDVATRNAYGFGSGEHVGWKGISYAYHGNDGDFVFNDGTKPYGGEWRAFGPSWGRVLTRPDYKNKDMCTVGCGLDANNRQIFFTLNGEMVGMAPVMALPGDYAAAVSLHAFGDQAVLNAGAAPFVFDIEAFCASP
ncbi:SPRY domain-containing proteins [Plasmopara halstedii]|uniref:SPRY domain-containing proteins n=1 Tax=Plasmopara halstedii TaxID=4781 RepID=A0A0P1B385_PLAHL|nr:SPRY domain-containing proteins [Plasmopara halstedii]CEG47942.1 SPRY domain-containing proteins [Plasmopara halstedii]|eukprot:XP_024584311.1 SPRY domain-containing proteins [Plasmopara halstedii]